MATGTAGIKVALEEIMARKMKLRPAGGGVETAVVYNDELPWDKDAGIVYEIKEARSYDLAHDCWRYEWQIRFGDHSYAYQRNFFHGDGLSEAMLDRYRKDAQLDILTRAHRDGLF